MVWIKSDSCWIAIKASSKPSSDDCAGYELRDYGLRGAHSSLASGFCYCDARVFFPQAELALRGFGLFNMELILGSRKSAGQSAGNH